MDAHPSPSAEQPDVSVVLPVYNERGNLLALDKEIRDALAGSGQRAEILYVDDNSEDGSSEVLKGLVEAARGTAIRTRLVTLRRRYGQTAALAAGFDRARGAVVVSLDADGQNDPVNIPRLLERIAEGYDVVSGWRRVRQDLLVSRRLPSQTANWLISKVGGLRLHDYGCTLKAYRASLLSEVRLYGDMHRFLPLFLAQLGARVSELEVGHRPRRSGTSKYGSERIAKVLADLVLIRFMIRYSNHPMQFFGQVGLLFLVAMAVAIGLMMAFKFGWLSLLGLAYQASFIETPLPALAATFFLGGWISFCFGIVGELLIRIQHETGGRSAYDVQRIDDSDETGS